MAAYFGNFIFGGAKVDFKGQSLSSNIYLGAKFASGAQSKTSAADAKGLDFGDDDYFKDKAVINVKRIDKFTDENLESITFDFYTSTDNVSFTKIPGSVTVSKDRINNAKVKPFRFMVPSNFDRYIVMKVTFNKKSSTELSTIAAGSFTAELVYPSY